MYWEYISTSPASANFTGISGKPQTPKVVADVPTYIGHGMPKFPY